MNKFTEVNQRKQLISFSLKYARNFFFRMTNSKLLLRNEKFLHEIDAIKRHISYVQYDN